METGHAFANRAFLNELRQIVSKKHRCGKYAVSTRSEKKAIAREFADFIQSSEGQEIFVKWGWMRP